MEACAKELSGVLRQQLLARPDEAAECIQMIARLGEPTESLQVGKAGSGTRERHQGIGSWIVVGILARGSGGSRAGV